MRKQARINNTAVCEARIAGIRDTMEVLSGKWKFHILGTLLQTDVSLETTACGCGNTVISTVSAEAHLLSPIPITTYFVV